MARSSVWEHLNRGKFRKQAKKEAKRNNRTEGREGRKKGTTVRGLTFGDRGEDLVTGGQSGTLCVL